VILRTLALALALASPGDTRAQTAPQQAPIAAVAAVGGGSWSTGDADDIAQVLSPAEVAIHLFGESHPAAGVRQARAALAELLGRDGSARVVRVEMLGGAPQRGFAELSWEVSAPGSPEGLRNVVFLGFVLEGDSWKIAEIRVFR